MSPSLETPSWYPDWAPTPPSQRVEQQPQPTPRGEDPTLSSPCLPTPDGNPNLRSLAPSSLITSTNEEYECRDGFTRPPPITIYVLPRKDRTVNRKLQGIHLFMITINGTLGTGLYWRGGQILELGGPLAVLLSFFLVGLLSVAVMQCITEMLCIWPIPGALSVYVREFVDVELGIAVGVAYWFTYSVSFSAIIATAAAEFGFWPGFNGNAGMNGGIVYALIPLCIVLINSLEIQLYALLEVFTGTLKLLFLLAIAVVLVVVNFGVGPGQHEYIGTRYWSDITKYDTAAADNWATAFLMSISIATFAYVGVEIVAASALEARWPRRSRKDEPARKAADMSLIGNTVKFTAVFLSILATCAYTISGVLVTLDIPRDDCQLPRLSWVNSTDDHCFGPRASNTTSAFVAIAVNSGIPHLGDIFNVFLVFTSLSCASTNLYVASRALFGLTSRLEGGRGQSWFLRLLSWFGKTNRRKVPVRAMVFSAVAFWWVPFLQLRGGTDAHTPIGTFIEVLAEMGSAGVLIVWLCECLAFIRFYHCIMAHQKELQEQKISQVRRWDADDYPYISHGQPLTAYAAFAGCFVVLTVINGVSLWKGFHSPAFLSSYLIVLAFLGLWVVLKLVRDDVEASWTFVDLSNPQRVINKILTLHDIRMGTVS